MNTVKERIDRYSVAGSAILVLLLVLLKLTEEGKLFRLDEAVGQSASLILHLFLLIGLLRLLILVGQSVAHASIAKRGPERVLWITLILCSGLASYLYYILNPEMRLGRRAA